MTPELTNAANTIGDQLQANILGVLPFIAGTLAVIIGISIGMAFIDEWYRGKKGKGLF